MGGLINGRTPEEIKRVLNGCDTLLCSECIYFKISKCDQRVFRDALALIAHLESERDAALAKVPKWISVKERLPEKWTDKESGTLVNYLVYMPEYGVDVGNYLQPADTWVCMGIPCKVTHWMPLPEPPEEK